MKEKYKNYLLNLEKKLNKYFEEQKEFLFCKKGCKICCNSNNNAVISATNVEYEYLRQGIIELLSKDQIKEIKNRSIKALKLLKENPNKDSEYECPFLFNEICCIYNYRPIICRIFGLILESRSNPGSLLLPFCIKYGLNYSNVFDDQCNFVPENLEKLGLKAYPKYYTYTDLLEGSEDIEFIEPKLLIEHIVEDNFL